MQTIATRHEPHTAAKGVVYRTTCQNPGCGFKFDLRITPENAGLLGGTMPCPRCHRRGGMLKREGRLGDRLFGAKLMFRALAVSHGTGEDEGDLFSERLN
ncbi:MAG TPA: hypothetical protein VMV15_01135 [Candidatus Binataceae bacterium]|nr:hypothetical protein [Candidatus Binataceae bacterium]